MCGNLRKPWELLKSHGPTWFSAVFLTITLPVPGFAAPARPQEPPAQTQSIVQAARNARELKASSPKEPRIFTNDDFLVGDSTTELVSPLTPPVTGASSPGCNNSEAERLKSELQAPEQGLEDAHREIADVPSGKVISNGDVDLKNFKPADSGLTIGSRARLETNPPATVRVTGVQLDQRVASLEAALRIACEPPEVGEIQAKIDAAQKVLEDDQRKFALDQNTYYSKPGFAADRTGQASLDAEQRQMEEQQADIADMKRRVAALKAEELAP
jgi:hypothetical protein